MWNFKAINHSTMQYRAFLIVKEIRGLELEELRDDLAHRLSREKAEQDDYVDFQTQEAFRLHGNNGPQVHRLLARLTEFLEIGSNESGRYPEYASRSRKKGDYQIEHLWANHPQEHEDEFPNHGDFASYRTESADWCCCETKTTTAILTWLTPTSTNTTRSRIFWLVRSTRLLTKRSGVSKIHKRNETSLCPKRNLQES